MWNLYVYAFIHLCQVYVAMIKSYNDRIHNDYIFSCNLIDWDTDMGRANMKNARLILAYEKNYNIVLF